MFHIASLALIQRDDDAVHSVEYLIRLFFNNKSNNDGDGAFAKNRALFLFLGHTTYHNITISVVVGQYLFRWAQYDAL